jgi:hypothetical protein
MTIVTNIEYLKSLHYIPDSAEGEWCGVCHVPATHKVEEVIDIGRHPFTTYLCCEHFCFIMGGLAKQSCDTWKESKNAG